MQAELTMGYEDAMEENEQIRLHFALGKALADVGRNDASFRHLLAGNALKRQAITYDEAATLAYTSPVLRWRMMVPAVYPPSVVTTSYVAFVPGTAPASPSIRKNVQPV